MAEKKKVKYEAETDEEGKIKEKYEAEAGEPTTSEDENERYTATSGN